MVGINYDKIDFKIDPKAKFLIYNDKKYYFTETTEKNYPIGKIFPQMSNIGKWQIVDLE